LNEELQDVFRNIDLRPKLAVIRAPTLVMHSKGDRIVPSACADALSNGIDGAKLVMLKSENHLPLVDESAWRVARSALRNFLRG
jgi:pimeloyl-ACP methyl ester carboxylesterase